MEILIISLPRTGSTELSKRISEQQKLTLIGEPFNDFYPEKRYYNENHIYKDCVLKTNIFHKPFFIREEDRLEWLINLSKKFNKTILLSRKDIKACAESWAFYSFRVKNFNFSHNLSYFWEKTPNYNESVKKINTWNEEINFLSKELNIPITYYEDNFDVNSTDRLRKGDLVINKII